MALSRDPCQNHFCQAAHARVPRTQRRVYLRGVGWVDEREACVLPTSSTGGAPFHWCVRRCTDSTALLEWEPSGAEETNAARHEWEWAAAAAGEADHPKEETRAALELVARAFTVRAPVQPGPIAIQDPCSSARRARRPRVHARCCPLPVAGEQRSLNADRLRLRPTAKSAAFIPGACDRPDRCSPVEVCMLSPP